MAVASIDEVLDFVHDENLKSLLTESKEHHETLGNELHSLFSEYNSSDKEPNPIAKGMSWIKTNMKLSMDSSDRLIKIEEKLCDGMHPYL